MSTSITPPVLHQIENAVAKDGVWIAPSVAAQIKPAVRRQIIAAAEQPHGPVGMHYAVILVDLNPDDPLTEGDPGSLVDVVHDDLLVRPAYEGKHVFVADDAVVLRPDTTHPPELALASRLGQDWPGAPQIAKLEHPDDLGAQVLDTLARLSLSDTKSDALYDTLVDRHQQLATELGYERTDAWRQHEDDSAALTVGIIVGILGLLVLAVVVAIADRRLRRRALIPAAATANAVPIAVSPFAPPRSVLASVRTTEEGRDEQLAAAGVLALGEAIDGAPLTATTPEGHTAWQAALDHYDAAQRILGRDHSPADAVGARVLAARGSDALAAAQADRAWTPSTPCYFNPLHPPTAGDAAWRDGRRKVEVPACEECRTALARGQEPAGILDFRDDGALLHYFRLDLGVWSRTAYGALDADLLGALVRDGHDVAAKN